VTADRSPYAGLSSAEINAMIQARLEADFEDPPPIRPPATPPVAETECRTCGEIEELEPVTARSLADGAERTEWFCADTPACNDRRFPELAALAAQAEAEAEL
jgi:hypothetical protein